MGAAALLLGIDEGRLGVYQSYQNGAIWEFIKVIRLALSGWRCVGLLPWYLVVRSKCAGSCGYQQLSNGWSWVALHH
jgi:hypothetical protein